MPFHDFYARNRSRPRNGGNGERGRGGKERDKVRIVFFVNRKNSNDNLHLAPEPMIKKRPDSPVNDSPRKDCFIRWPSLAADKTAADDFARGVEPLFVINGEREIIHLLVLIAHDNGHEHRRVIVLSQDRGGCLFGELRDFDRKRTTRKFSGKLLTIKIHNKGKCAGAYRA